jgi:hypothetical protein
MSGIIDTKSMQVIMGGGGSETNVADAYGRPTAIGREPLTAAEITQAPSPSAAFEQNLMLEVESELRLAKRQLKVSRFAFVAMLAASGILCGIAVLMNFSSAGSAFWFAIVPLTLVGAIAAHVAIQNFAMESECLQNTLRRLSGDRVD